MSNPGEQLACLRSHANSMLVSDFRQTSSAVLNSLIVLVNFNRDLISNKQLTQFVIDIFDSASGAILDDARTPWKDGEPILVFVGLLKLLRLFTPTSDRFPTIAIEFVEDVERQHTRVLNSPFRTPLIEYLDNIPKEAADFFFDRLSQPHFLDSS